MIDVAFCKFLFINVVKTYYLCAENLPVRAMFTRKRHRTVIILVWFLEWKSWLWLHRSGPFPYQFLGCVHTDTVSYRSEAFRAKTSKRKSDMSTNFCRIRSNFYFKFNKHEKKCWRVLSSNLSNSGLFTRTSKYLQIKRNRHRENEIWWNFQFNYSGKLEVLCIKSPKKFHKILVHKIHQAPTEFFLRHCESECLWLLNSPEAGKRFV